MTRKKEEAKTKATNYATWMLVNLAEPIKQTIRSQGRTQNKSTDNHNMLLKVNVQIQTCNSFLVRSSTRLVCTTTNGFCPLMAKVYAFGTGLCRTYRSGASIFSICAASVIN